MRYRMLVVAALLAWVGSVVGQPSPATPDIPILLRNARQAGEHGNFQEAIRLYREILRERPDWLAAKFDLAVAYHFAGDYPDAVRLFSRVLQREPNLAKAYLLRGIGYYQLNNYQLAIASLHRASKLEPNNPEEYFYLGASYYQLADYAHAALAYLDQLAIQPESGDAYFQLVQCYVALKESAVQQINADENANYFALLLEAEERLRQHDLSGAKSQASAAQMLDDGSPEAFIILAKTAEAAGQQLDSETNWKRAHEANEKLSSEFAGIIEPVERKDKHCGDAQNIASALCHANQSQLNLSTRQMVEITEAHPRDLRTLYWAGQVFDRLTNAAILKLAQIAPGSPNLLRLYARSFDREGQRREAAEAYDKALGLDDHNASLLIEYANFCSRGQEFDRTIALLEKASRLSPYDDKLQLLLAEACVQNQQPERAIPYFKKALQTDHANRMARLELAQALHTVNRTAEAIALLQAAPSDPDGRFAYMLATYYARQGQRDKAREAMQVFEEKRKKSVAQQ